MRLAWLTLCHLCFDDTACPPGWSFQLALTMGKVEPKAWHMEGLWEEGTGIVWQSE